MKGFINSTATSVLPDLILIENTYTDFIYPKHFHEKHCIQIIEEGTDSLYCNGTNYNNLTTDNVILINPGEVHTGGSGSRKNNSNLVCKVFYPDFNEWQNVLGESAGSCHLSSVYFKESVITDKRIIHAIKRMYSIGDVDENNLLLKEIYHEIMFRLITGHISTVLKFNDSFTRYFSAIERGKEYINDKLCSRLLLEDIARAAYLSPFHFLRIFKKFTGITLHQYVLSLRVERAKALFRHGGDIVNTFCHVGFINQGHFNKVFKKMTGLTPMQYKKMVKN